MSPPAPAPAPAPPGRVLLRLAGVLTQLTCGVCLLIGTIGLVLVQQNKTGSTAAVAAWLVAAMAGLVFGGLSYRGGVISMVIAAAIDASFGVILIVIELDTLRRLLKILPASDVDSIGDALNVAGFAMAGAGALCLIAVPQGVRFARWFRDAAATRTAMSTARGFPPPVPAYGSVMIIPAEEAPASRRRLYMVLGGLAIGVGAGVGVLVSTPPEATRSDPAITRPVKRAVGPGTSQPTSDAGVGSNQIATRAPEAPVTAVDAGTVHDARATDVRPADTVQRLLTAQRAALAKADPKALAALVVPSVFGFGLDADEVAEGRDAVTTQLIVDLGEMPSTGFTIASTALTIGQERDHAWIAEELEVSAVGRSSRTLAISELAAMINGTWQVVALHWATPVTDATAQRLAILKTLPMPRPITDRHDGSAELDSAVRAAFASRAAFAEARSERPDAFNYGSGGERAHGGTAIKRIFTKLKAQIRLRDGARVADGSAWDPAQKAAPWIGWAAVNVDFTARTRAATEVTQTFRVLAIMLKEGSAWKIVQTQWSNGGPIR
ncbi:MAG: nuclear transport factor 2 family protein [Kofleriaceae bacterium]